MREENAPVLLPTDEEYGAATGLHISRPHNNESSRRDVARKLIPFLFSLAVFLFTLREENAIANYLSPPVALSGNVPPSAVAAAARCLAVFVFCVALWATGAIPLHVTALGVAPLCVYTQVFLNENGTPMSAAEAADSVLAAYGSDAVFMVLGVYTLGAALQKTCFEALLSRALFSVATTPRRMLAVVMLAALAVSALVSNVFAPVLLLSILSPLFKSLERERRPLAQALVLGVSVASNIGGMPSPVASPQNIVARALLKDVGGVSFIEWIVIAAPQCFAMLLIGYALIIARFRPGRYSIHAADAHVVPVRPSMIDLFVLTAFATTIYLWVSASGDALFGHAGVVAVIPLVGLFGAGALTLEDFKELPWNVVWLVAGGTALGEAVSSSHLLNLVAFKCTGLLRSSTTFMAVSLVVFFMAVVAEGISHTVSAIIVLPLVMKVGQSLGHPRLLVMAGVFACSGAMSLPVSSFPNMSAFGLRDSMGEPFLTPADILVSGLPMTVACSVVISTLGFFVMSVLYNM